jgi:hypothetical protein
MGTHRVADKNRIEFKVPYVKALRAFAYSGLVYSKAIEIIETICLVAPEGTQTKPYQAQYGRWQVEARRSNKLYRFSAMQARKHNIEPLYSYAVNRDDPSRNHAASQVNELMASINNKPLRRAVDILLYLGDSPEVISATLEERGFRPRLGADLIGIYWEFFWDTQELSHEDWEQYLKWMGSGNDTRFHVQSLGTKREDQLRCDACIGHPVDSDKAIQEQMSALHNVFQNAYSVMFQPNGKVDVGDLCRLSSTFIRQRNSIGSIGTDQPGGGGPGGDPSMPTRFRVILTERERQAERLSHADLGITGLPTPLQDLEGEYSDPYQSVMLPRESGQEEI